MRQLWLLCQVSGPFCASPALYERLSSVEEASAVARGYAERTGAGSRDWLQGVVFEHDDATGESRKVATVRYNGTIVPASEPPRRPGRLRIQLGMADHLRLVAVARACLDEQRDAGEPLDLSCCEDLLADAQLRRLPPADYWEELNAVEVQARAALGGGAS